jgi:hypothetical protein
MYGLGADDLTQVMGLGYVGEVRQGPDGNLYEWVQGVDGLGNPVGFWRALRRFVRRKVRPFVRRALPMVQKFAPFIPGVGPAVAAGITAAAPVLRQAGVAGYNGLGALYQAPDGNLYQMSGYGGYAGDEALDGLEADDELGYFAEADELRGYAGDDLTQVMGLGYVGEVRQGPDGNLYEWVQGVDGLGNPVGFWRALRRFVRRKVRPFVQRVLPMAQKYASFIPGVGPAVAAGITAAAPVLRQAGVAGYDGLGALYQAPDGNLYQMSGYGGYAGDEALDGLEADDALGYFAETDELRGYAGDEELSGLEADDELSGFTGDEELNSYGEAEEMAGYGESDELGDIDGYILDQRMSGLEAYVPDQPAGTRVFTAQTPETWKAIW